MLLSIVVAEYILKVSFRQKRPEGACSGSYGMPSGHSSISICLFFYCIFFSLRKEIHIIYIPLSTLMVTNIAISRLYLGYHSLNQIMGGFVTGTVISSLYLFGLSLYLRKPNRKVKRLRSFRLESKTFEVSDSGTYNFEI
mmetsp:Transcript_19662/g.21956  ORF Transcript_19662/g.21956 Transcript_19662/m.21956 type:complete len:140 (+) Transcript_19662:212-631(+)